MPNGYLVAPQPGRSLAAGDAVRTAFVAFTPVRSLGTGVWAFSGMAGGIHYAGETEACEFFRSADGRVYLVPDLGPVTTLTAAHTVRVPARTARNRKPDIASGLPEDEDDDTSLAESLCWFGEPAGTTITGTSGRIDVAARAERAGGRPGDGDLDLRICADHGALTLTTGPGGESTLHLEFSASAGADLGDAVARLAFRIDGPDTAADDGESGLDITATAPGDIGMPVTLTPDPAGAGGSVLVEIAGPVSDVAIAHRNRRSGVSAIAISTLFFEVIPTGTEVRNPLRPAEAAPRQDDPPARFDLGETSDTSAGKPNSVNMLEDFTPQRPGTGGGRKPTVRPTPELDAAVAFPGIESLICFTPGTILATGRGPRPIEDLAPGDEVVTRDHGLQTIRWTGRTTVTAEGALAPIRIDPVLLDGANAPLLVSPMHRLMWSGPRAQMLFGEEEVLVSAQDLLGSPAARRVEGGSVTYLHLMTECHELVYANGAPAETFYPDDAALAALSDEVRNRLFAQVPELRGDSGSFAGTARVCLRAHEARVLTA